MYVNLLKWLFSILLVICLVWELLGQKLIVHLILWIITKLFSTGLNHLTFQLVIYKSFIFSKFSQILVIFYYFYQYFILSSVPQLVLIYIFSLSNDIDYISVSVLGHLCIFTRDMFSFPYFLIVLSFGYWHMVIYIFLYYTIIRYMICKYFLPFCMLTFLDNVLWWANDEAPCIYFSIYH
jgi:hypothetical protein